MKKIVLAGLPNASNQGDSVLFESTQYLAMKALKELSLESEIIKLDFQGCNIGILHTIEKVFNKIWGMIDFDKDQYSKIHYIIRKNIYSFLLKRYFRSIIKDTSAIIIVGGGLIKYKYESFDYRLILLISEAERFGIPIYLNAVGIEGYSETNIRCQELKVYLNSKSIKSISTRDDLELLTHRYIINPDIRMLKVADSAFWSNKVYHINKKSESKVVGLGVIRGKIFEDNGLDLSETDLLNLWIGIINKLDKEGIKWKLFTNGFKEDNEFMYLLLKRLNRLNEKNQLTIVPKAAKELVKIISEFEKIIACRMHASIIAYSLDIPSIGLVWNDKIKMFGESIGHPDRFITSEDLKSEYIVEKLINIENDLSDKKFKNEYQMTTYLEIKRFILRVIG